MGRRLTDADIEDLLDPSNPGIDRPALSALVSELRRQYTATPDLAPGDELVQAMWPAAGDDRSAPVAEARLPPARTRKVLAGVTALVATTAGKVLTNMPTISAMPGISGGRIEATDPKQTSRRPV